MTRLVISLDGAERSALVTLAEIERRNPRDQAAVIIRQDLVRRGLLDLPKSDQVRAQPEPAGLEVTQ
ncbi:MAG: hypothetical protein JW850_20315 [Thermoflexales bacterium]|nr:hypothetical protein [Thermoflexales bacterium]